MQGLTLNVEVKSMRKINEALKLTQQFKKRTQIYVCFVRLENLIYQNNPFII